MVSVKFYKMRQDSNQMRSRDINTVIFVSERGRTEGFVRAVESKEFEISFYTFTDGAC